MSELSELLEFAMRYAGVGLLAVALALSVIAVADDVYAAWPRVIRTRRRAQSALTRLAERLRVLYGHRG